MEDTENFLDTVLSNEFDYGTGVWSSVNDKLSIRMNSFGEYETYIKKEKEVFTEYELDSLKEVNCLLSQFNETDLGKELFSEIESINYDSRIGYFQNLYIGHVAEGEYRKNASSGGFGTWIFTELLRLGYIDSVIHVKKSTNSDKLFEYSISKTMNDIIQGAKTKYYPVELSEVLKIIKTTPGKYAVIGLPSFIMELRLLSKQDTNINDRIKFYIGLVCGHQKSTKFTDLLGWQCGIKPGDIQSIDYRKKLDYGPSSSYAVEVQGLVDGKMETVVKEMKQIYGGDWGKGLFKVRASDFSDDVMNETADITLGDAWLREYTKDNKGNNILVVRNTIIDEIIQNAMAEGRIKLTPTDSDTIQRSQMSHYRHSQDELGYRLYKLNKKKKWIPTKRIEPSKDISFARKRIQDLREKYCELTPIFFEKAMELDDFEYLKKQLRIYDLEYSFFYKLIDLNRKIGRAFEILNLKNRKS